MEISGWASLLIVIVVFVIAMPLSHIAVYLAGIGRLGYIVLGGVGALIGGILTQRVGLPFWDVVGHTVLNAFLGCLAAIYVHGDVIKDRAAKLKKLDDAGRERQQKDDALSRALDWAQDVDRKLTIQVEEAERFERRLKDEQQRAREAHRDAEFQDEPYVYEMNGRHPNETLALRYGIANTVEKKAYLTYSLRGGERAEDQSSYTLQIEEANTIKLRKLGKQAMIRVDKGRSDRDDQSTYLVEITDFGKRKALAVIEAGTEYVKTFLPFDDRWFQLNGHLENTLKDNHTMTLKEIAIFHVTKAQMPRPMHKRQPNPRLDVQDDSTNPG